MSDKRKPRPRLELHFSDEQGDVSAGAWDEIQIQAEASSVWLNPHALAADICDRALCTWANEQRDDRRTREAEAAAEAKAEKDADVLETMDDTTKLASVDDPEALVVRLREITCLPDERRVLSEEAIPLVYGPEADA